MGSGQSAAPTGATDATSTITIELSAVQEHLNIITRLKANIKEEAERNKDLKDELNLSEGEVNKLKIELAQKRAEVLSISTNKDLMEKQINQKEITMEMEKRNWQESCKNYQSQVDTLVSELAHVKQLNLYKKENEYKQLTKELEEIQSTKQDLQEKLNIKTSELSSLIKTNKASQNERENVQLELENLHRQLKENIENLNSANNQLEIKTKTCEKLNVRVSKLQLELEQYKSNEHTIQLIEVHQIVKKLASQVDATVKKLLNEIKYQKSINNESQLEKWTSEYCNSSVPNRHFETCVAKYKHVCKVNVENITMAMKTVYEIDKEVNKLSEMLQNEIPLIISHIKSPAEKYTKEIFKLKQLSFTGDFKQERKLWAEVVAAAQQITNVNGPLHNLDRNFVHKNQQQSNINFNRESQNYKVIIYNFPENMQDGNEGAAMDAVNIKYLLDRLELGNLDNFIIQRLAFVRNYKIRPVLVTLPNFESMQKILNSSQSFTEFNLPNIKVARYFGAAN